MAEIKIVAHDGYEGWMFDVTVSEEGSKDTRHQVTITRGHYERLASGLEPEVLVRASFEFLLEREPKEQIEPQFELTDISRYFKEYEREIRWRIRS
jgi:hypothetical protein